MFTSYIISHHILSNNPRGELANPFGCLFFIGTGAILTMEGRRGGGGAGEEKKLKKIQKPSKLTLKSVFLIFYWYLQLPYENNLCHNDSKVEI